VALNGRLPASALAPIPGGRLSKAAALRWNALCYCQRARGRPVPMPNGPASSYRTFLQQVALKRSWTLRGHPENAATPGTSNHGLGIAVDTDEHRVCDDNPQFGFHARFSDAPWEPWHRKWGGFGSTHGGQTYEYELTTIHKGSQRAAAISHLQALLRGTGYLRASWRVHGKYTLTVRRAVRKFQADHRMKVDGVVGPSTWSALRRAYDRKH
jgi:hypothetical protein